jgi:hypothetical protein
MSTYKNTSGDLTLTGDGGLATLTVNYANTIFNGSFTYTGNLTTVDDFIVVAANNTGTIQDMGLLAAINVTTGTYAGLRFDTVANTWQISSSVYGNGVPNAPYQNIASGSSGIPGGNIYDVQVNNGSGGFTANVNLQYNPSTSKLTLTGVQVLSNVGVAPTAVANSVSIYNNAPGSGQTGLYVTGNTIATDEVISLTRAKIYSIIF